MLYLEQFTQNLFLIQWIYTTLLIYPTINVIVVMNNLPKPCLHSCTMKTTKESQISTKIRINSTKWSPLLQKNKNKTPQKTLNQNLRVPTCTVSSILAVEFRTNESLTNNPLTSELMNGFGIRTNPLAHSKQHKLINLSTPNITDLWGVISWIVHHLLPTFLFRKTFRKSVWLFLPSEGRKDPAWSSLGLWNLISGPLPSSLLPTRI